MKRIGKAALLCAVSAFILCGSALAAQFTDVPKDAWYAEAVQFVSDNGLMNGTADHIFSPDSPLTRAQFITIMYRMKDSPSVSGTAFQKSAAFGDLPETAWYHDAAAWGIDQGIILGYATPSGGSMFYGERPVTRSQLFALLYRAAGAPSVTNDNSDPFADESEIPGVFADATLWAKKMGIAIADKENRLEPNAAASRAYVAAVLRSFLTAYPDQMTAGVITQYTKVYKPFLISEAVYPVNAARYPNQKLSGELAPFFSSAIRQFLSGSEDKNIVCSPLNLYIALGMLSEICGGESRQQIFSLLGVENLDDLHTRAGALWNTNYYHNDTASSLLANSIWINQKINQLLKEKLNQSTLDAVAEYFYASSFQGNAGEDAYDKALRAWLNEQTGSLLSDQVENISMDEYTILALVSAVSFHAEWVERFYENLTESDKFHAKSGDITCDFMHETDSSYYTGRQFSASYKRMKNGSSMWFVLPNEGVTPDELLQDEETSRFITGDKESWRYESKADKLYVNKSIPKFDVASETDLKEGLTQLGVTDIFDQNIADFTPLTSEISVEVTEARHDARVSIDEKGCTAAAFTIIRPGVGSAPILTVEEIDFILDRPFLFFITDSNNIPLFAGIVNQPADK